MGLGSREIFIFWEIIDNVSQMVQDGGIVTIKVNGRLIENRVAYQMILSNLHGHCSCLKPFGLLYFGQYGTFYL